MGAHKRVTTVTKAPIDRRALIAAAAISAFFGMASLIATPPAQAAQTGKSEAGKSDADHKGCDKYDKSSKEYTDCMNTN